MTPDAAARESISLLISDDIEEFNEAADAFIDNADRNVEVFRLHGDRATAYRVCESLQNRLTTTNCGHRGQGGVGGKATVANGSLGVCDGRAP